MKTVLTGLAMLAATAALAQTPPATPEPAATEAQTMTPAPAQAAPAAGEAITEKAAREKLAAADYGTVRSLTRNPDGGWAAVVRKGSKEQRVTVAADGSVTPDAPM